MHTYENEDNMCNIMNASLRVFKREEEFVEP